jgi:hypothetical protein
MRVWLTQRCAGGARILCVAPPGIQKCLTVVSLEALLNPSHVGAVCVFEFFVNGPFFFFFISLFSLKKKLHLNPLDFLYFNFNPYSLDF